MDTLFLQKNSIRLLALFNAILLSLSWLMMARAYSLLPGEIPYWLPLGGQDVLRAPKGPFFFLYPLFQTLFLLAIYLVGTIWIKQQEKKVARGINEERKTSTGKISASDRPAAGEGRTVDAETAGEGLVSEREVDGRKQLSSQEAEAEYHPDEISPGFRTAVINLKKEIVWLLMIFLNLVFIHIQRSLIWLAHGLSFGLNKFYFFSLIVIMLLLIPYYRFRLSLLKRENR